MAQVILGTLLNHPHDGVGAYYRSRPVAALASASRSRTRSAARSAGPVASATGGTSASCATCPAADVRSCCPCRATWARSTRRRRAGRSRCAITGTHSATRPGGAHRRCAWRRCVGRDERLLVGAHDGHDAQAPDALLHRGQRPRHLGARANADAGRQHRAQSRVASRTCSCAMATAPIRTRVPRLLKEGVDHVRAGSGPALVRLTVPRLSSHSGPDNQKGYRTRRGDRGGLVARSRCRASSRTSSRRCFSEDEWQALEAEVTRDVNAALAAARGRPTSGPGRREALRVR